MTRFFAIYLLSVVILPTNSCMAQDKTSWEIGGLFSHNYYAGTPRQEDSYSNIRTSGFNFSAGLISARKIAPKNELIAGLVYTRIHFEGRIECYECYMGTSRYSYYNEYGEAVSNLMEIPVYMRVTLGNGNLQPHLEFGLNAGYLLNGSSIYSSDNNFTHTGFALNTRLGVGLHTKIAERLKLAGTVAHYYTLANYYESDHSDPTLNAFRLTALLTYRMNP